MSGATAFGPEELQRSLANLKLERDAIVLYDRLASIERDPRRAAAFRTIAGNERRHAEIWAERLREAGVDVPVAGGPRPRVRFILGLARVFGTRAVSDLVKSLEGDEEELYEAQDDPVVASIAADEREHAEIWQRLDAGLPGVATMAGAASIAGDGTAAATIDAGALGPGAAVGAQPEQYQGRPDATSSRRGHTESWHRSGRAGTLRAAIFGINDGLVSNLALVMGVAGATADNQFIILAGVAGLLAGAFSMAAGEYISMQSQRELFERQISVEREEMRIMPETEQRELAAIFRGKGLSSQEASMVARRLMQDPDAALDTKIREELGLDPDELGSAWGAAGSSFAAFGIGAFLPLAPFLMTSGVPALVASVIVALAALFVVGAGVSLLTGRGFLFSGLRQVAIGGAAAAVTYVVGTIIGVQISMTSEARSRMEADGLEPSSWSNGPGDRYAAHQHGYDKVIVAAQGSIAFGLPDRGETIDLGAGDRLDLPAGTAHDAIVGGAGVVCLEAHLSAGVLGPAPRVTRSWVSTETAAPRPA